MATLIKDQGGKDPSSKDDMSSASNPGEKATRVVVKGPPPKYPGRGSDAAAPASRGRGFFTIYKKGQGKWTRMGTIAGAAIIGALTLKFIYDEKLTFHIRSDNVAYLVCAIFAAVYSLLVFLLMNKPRNADFLIATDSEMKKVNWTSKKELIGSTKVVILFMFVIAMFLFFIDIFFGYFFYLLNVLKTPPL